MSVAAGERRATREDARAGLDDGRPLRISVSSDYPTVSIRGVGGLCAHTSALAHAIAELGHDVSVVTQSERSADVHRDGPITVHAIARGSQRMWKLGTLLPVSWLRRFHAATREVRRLHRTQPFDLVSFPDGYAEGLCHLFAPVAPCAVRLFGPASFVQRWDGRAVPPIRRWVES